MSQQDDYISTNVEQHVKFLMLLRDIYYRKKLFKIDGISCSSFIGRVTSSCNQKSDAEVGWAAAVRARAVTKFFLSCSSRPIYLQKVECT